MCTLAALLAQRPASPADQLADPAHLERINGPRILPSARAQQIIVLPSYVLINKPPIIGRARRLLVRGQHTAYKRRARSALRARPLVRSLTSPSARDTL